MTLSLIDKVTTGTQSFALFIWNVTTFACIADTSWTGGLASGFPVILDFINIWDIIHSSDYDKSSFISQLINGKWRDLQKLLKYFNGTATSASNVLLSSDAPYWFFLIFKRFTRYFCCCYLSFY